MLTKEETTPRVHKTPLVIQHNKLVQSSYRVTLQEKRLLLWLISQIRSEDKDFKKYTLKISDFVKMLGLESNHNIYKELQHITKNLLSRVITIELPEERKLIQLSFVSSSVYKYREGVVEFSFDPALKPYLLELNKHFTSFSLNAVIGFSSVHAIRIYELLKQYETIGNRRLTIASIRSYLGIGVLEYKTYAALKNRVLKIAQREINNKSDICFTYEENKTGRRVTSIKCIITKNNKFQKTPLPPPVLCVEQTPLNTNDVSEEKNGYINDSLAQHLEKIWFIHRNVIDRLFRDYPSDYIESIVKDVKRRLEHKDIRNASAYLIKAIENGWNSRSSDEIIAAINESAVTQHLKEAPHYVWRDVLNELLNFFDKGVYVSWFSKITFIDYKDHILYLQAPTSFIKSYIEDHYCRYIQRFWHKCTQGKEDIKIVITTLSKT